MKQIKVTKGLDLRLAGAPDQTGVPEPKDAKRFAVTGVDYVGLKPTIFVEIGEKVRAGQPLFEDKKNPDVKFVSPVTGVVSEVVRGEKRAFRSIVIEAAPGDARREALQFESVAPQELLGMKDETVRKILARSGLWTSLRTRPFSRIPKLNATPVALFVNAANTNPHAPDPKPIVDANRDAFLNGLCVLTNLGASRNWVCLGKGEYDKKFIDSVESLPKTQAVQFVGKHPAGLSGTHIAALDPCGLGKFVWTIDYQDVIAIGKFFVDGVYSSERVVSLSGPQVKRPRLLSVMQGAFVSELADGELADGATRLISGSVLCGRTIEPGCEGLGRYVDQISAIEDSDPREFLGWFSPSFDKFSIARTVASKWFPRKSYKTTTALGGGARAIFPNPAFDHISPLDIVPTFLFKALEVGDVDRCEQLGAFELDEEDLALFTLVDFGKNDYGKSLRALLNAVMKEEE